MRDHVVFSGGRSHPFAPPAAATAAAAAASTASANTSIPNGRPPAPAVASPFPSSSSAAAPLPRAPPPSGPGLTSSAPSGPSIWPTAAALHPFSSSSSLASSAAGNGGSSFFGRGSGLGGSSNSHSHSHNHHKRPLASLNPNSSASSTAGLLFDGVSSGHGQNGGCSMNYTVNMMMMEEDRPATTANYTNTTNNTASSSNVSYNDSYSHRGAAALAASPPAAWSLPASAAAVPAAATAPPMTQRQQQQQQQRRQQPSPPPRPPGGGRRGSGKRSRPTPTVASVRRRLAVRLVGAVRRTPHSHSSNNDCSYSASARPHSAIVECLDGEEGRVCSSSCSAVVGMDGGTPTPTPAVPYGLFFTPEQARTRAGWEVRQVVQPARGGCGDGGGDVGDVGDKHRTTTTATTIWTLHGSAASEWIQDAIGEGTNNGGGGGGMNGDGNAAQPAPRQPFHIHPVPYDGPVRVGYGGRRQRMYACAGVEALEARFEAGCPNSGGGGQDGGGQGGGGGRLTLTVRTHLAGLVDEAQVTFSPWG